MRAENGLTHEATIVGAFPVIAGALVQHAKGGEASGGIQIEPELRHIGDQVIEQERRRRGRKLVLVDAGADQDGRALDIPGGEQRLFDYAR